MVCSPTANHSIITFNADRNFSHGLTYYLISVPISYAMCITCILPKNLSFPSPIAFALADWFPCKLQLTCRLITDSFSSCVLPERQATSTQCRLASWFASPRNTISSQSGLNQASISLQSGLNLRSIRTRADGDKLTDVSERCIVS